MFRVLFLLSDADGSLLKYIDSVICGRSRVSTIIFMIFEIVFKLDIGLKLAGSLTFIQAYIRNGKT